MHLEKQFEAKFSKNFVSVQLHHSCDNYISRTSLDRSIDSSSKSMTDADPIAIKLLWCLAKVF